jgi:hypothetical protein
MAEAARGVEGQRYATWKVPRRAAARDATVCCSCVSCRAASTVARCMCYVCRRALVPERTQSDMDGSSDAGVVVPHWLRAVRFHSRPRCMAWQQSMPRSSLPARRLASIHSPPPLLVCCPLDIHIEPVPSPAADAHLHRHRRRSAASLRCRPRCSACCCCCCPPVVRPDNKAPTVRPARHQTLRQASPPAARPRSARPISGTALQKPSCSHRGRNTPAQSRFVSDRVRIHDSEPRAAGSQDKHHIV